MARLKWNWTVYNKRTAVDEITSSSSVAITPSGARDINRLPPHLYLLPEP